MKLLALDLDGTLLRRDKTIAPADRQALERARAAGVLVSLVTGRLLSSTLSVADDLGLDGPLVCADGGLVVGPGGVVLERFPMHPDDVRSALAAAEASGLGAFALTDDAVHYDEGAAPHAVYASGWTPNLRRHARLAAAEEAQGHVLGFIAFGSAPKVTAAHEAIRVGCGSTSVLTFSMGEDSHVLKLTPASVTKATGLAAVAARLGVAQADVVAVGDWYNDLAMLRWAGTSFAMGGAPEEVRAAAHFELAAQAHEGGGVAEVVDRLLAGG